MNSKTLRAKYLKFAILIISVCFILGAISACLPFNLSVPTLDNDTINTMSRPTTPTTNGFSYFADGVKYVYSDKDSLAQDGRRVYERLAPRRDRRWNEGESQGN